MSTTKGTGGSIIILEEAAQVDPAFFFETVAPLLIVGETTLIGISTLLSSTNFYTRLLRLRDKATNSPIFTVLSVELACAACKENGKAAECVHMLHLIPRYLPFPCQIASDTASICLIIPHDFRCVLQVAVGRATRPASRDYG